MMERDFFVKYLSLFIMLFAVFSASCLYSNRNRPLLDKDSFLHYVDSFNNDDCEDVINCIPNEECWKWMCDNVPFFECPDQNIEEIYFYRWWSLRKHIKQTPEGFVFTEFIEPVGHAGIYNTVSCALGHHIMEGRWVHNQNYLDDYIYFWFRGNEGLPQIHFHKFSSWVADAVYQRYMVNKQDEFVVDILPDLIDDFKMWEQEKLSDNGLFWQYDVRDGMEESVSGSRTKKHCRPTINSYMAGNALAISALARLSGEREISILFKEKYSHLRKLMMKKLWDSEAEFFKVLQENGSLSDAREAIGFIPWYFNLPDERHNNAWKQLTDTCGFMAHCGITTTERRHPLFRSHGKGSCEWDGAVWPFATSQTLVAMGNLIRKYDQSVISRRDYYKVLYNYATSHEKNGKPYIGEYLDECTGEWIKGDNPRSRFYNHSCFCDHVISGLAGIVPRDDEILEIDPLLPEDKWDWFGLDGILYHGHDISVFYDKTGKRYKNGKGLSIYIDGKRRYRSRRFKKVCLKLPVLPKHNM